MYEKWPIVKLQVRGVATSKAPVAGELNMPKDSIVNRSFASHETGIKTKSALSINEPTDASHLSLNGQVSTPEQSPHGKSACSGFSKSFADVESEGKLPTRHVTSRDLNRHTNCIYLGAPTNPRASSVDLDKELSQSPFSISYSKRGDIALKKLKVILASFQTWRVFPW
ncbi:hypothetical protein RRG08_033801 [Elysia crispata]|uniref:Uncharacterized protein n=1 Tax=Elysia crispata TaxID=231223 RepID=A0AAE1CN06_9GAST|nr:hypothetical protein RRG08_033801 [Elysia crispata]